MCVLICLLEGKPLTEADGIKTPYKIVSHYKYTCLLYHCPLMEVCMCIDC